MRGKKMSKYWQQTHSSIFALFENELEARDTLQDRAGDSEAF